MKRSMCGFVMLTAATALWSCAGDPTESFQDGQRIMADPSSLFLAQDESQFVEVTMVDNQGNQLAADFEIQNLGPGLTVVKDTAFLETTIGTNLETTERFVVTGTAPAATSFDLVSGGQSVTVPVKVTPLSTSVTLSNAAPAANEPVVITLPAGYTFSEAAGVSLAGETGLILSVDGASMTALLPPGEAGELTLEGVNVDFAPGVDFTLPTVETVTVGTVTPLTGTTDPATAPALAIPPAGGTTALYDAPDFAASTSHFYRLDFPEAGDYTVTLDWDVGTDIDMILCFDASCSTFDAAAATGNQPEETTYTIEAPATAYLLIDDFGADAAGANIGISITR